MTHNKITKITLEINKKIELKILIKTVIVYK